VATRQSTDVVAVGDPAVRKAARHIRDHYTSNVRVGDLVQVAGVSRSILERRFKKWLGASPYDHLLALRFSEAERLLLESGLSIAEISSRLGFGSPEHFNALFRKRRGFPPGALRKKRGTMSA